MRIRFDYQVSVADYSHGFTFQFKLFVTIEGWKVITYTAEHPSKREAARQAIELFAAAHTPLTGNVEIDLFRFQFSRKDRRLVFITDHLPDDEIKQTILQVLEFRMSPVFDTKNAVFPRN